MCLAGSARAQTTDPVEQTFLEARTLWRANQLEDAVPLLEGLIADHLDHAMAEPSVDLLLDALNRLARHDRLAEWVERLLKEEQFLARSPQAAATLQALQQQIGRKRAERLEVAKDYLGCGKAYLDLFQADPAGRHADELVYNAGVCFSEAGSMGAAIQMFTLLVDRFPRSAIARRGLIRLASALDAIAYYEQAAPRFELYAARHPADPEAKDALLRAIELRLALGQHREALKQTERFVYVYKRKHSADTARLWLAATDFHATDQLDARIAHLRRYLKEYARAGSAFDRVVAHARLGELLWKRSCASSDATGLCVKRVRTARASAKVTRCAPPPTLQPVARNATLVREARAAFSEAVQLFGRTRGTATPPLEATDASAMARFYLAEPEVEAMLAMRAPGMKNFDPSKPTGSQLAQFHEWIRLSNEALARFGGTNGPLYGELLRAPAARSWRAAAMLRTGQVHRAFANAFGSIEIPTKLQTGSFAADVVKAYCDEFGNRLEPITYAAENALQACVEASDPSEWTLACARELEASFPEDHPRVRELLGRTAPEPHFDRGPSLLSRAETPAATP